MVFKVSKTAYELKVTCKNPRNQFYKAICKALLKNSPDKEQKEVNNNEEKDNVVDKLILIGFDVKIVKID